VQGLISPSGERFADPALEELDLAIYPELYVESIDGQDVRSYQDLPQLVPA
jgi:hypothetical protein